MAVNHLFCKIIYLSLRYVFNKHGETKKQYEIFHRIRIFDGEGHFVGKGRIELLELIQKHGSITRAAAEMKMSYRQAWQMVEEMNLLAEEPLVEKMPGGKGGGGTKLTASERKP